MALLVLFWFLVVAKAVVLLWLLVVIVSYHQFMFFAVMVAVLLFLVALMVVAVLWVSVSGSFGILQGTTISGQRIMCVAQL